MRLLVDCHVFDGKFQGTRTYLQGIYQNLVGHKNINFYFAACDIENIKHVFGMAENIHYVQLTTGNSIKRLALELPRIIKQYRIDFAHYQYVSPLPKLCKEIVTIHDLLFLDYPQYFPLSYRIKNTFFFRRSAKRADILLTVSPYSKKEIVRHFDINEDIIQITPNGVLLPSESTKLPDVKKKYGLDKYILTVSRIEPRKNHQMLLQAFVELGLADKGYKLVIVGMKDLKNEIFNHYFDLLPKSIKDNIFVFQAPYLDLISLYKHASLFVFPSFAEGFGIPPIEAVSLGCTTLCSKATAMSDFDFLADKLFDPSNLEELKEKISYWLENENENISQEQNTIRERFDWKCIAERFYKIIEKNI